MDPKESLKRVLKNIKGKAREMRKGNLNARINPKKPEAVVEEEILPLEVPDDALAEGDESPADKKAESAREAAAIKKLLARS